MSFRSTSTEEASVVALVRQNAGSAGFAAVSLLFFGFGWFVPPTVTDLFSAGDAVFTYTLRFGGVAMAAITLGSLLGMRIFLIVDAIVSVAIGALLATSAVMMMIAGGFGLNQILYLAFGGMFVSAGIRNGRNHAAIIRATQDRPAEQQLAGNRDPFPRERFKPKEVIHEAIPLAPAYPPEDDNAEDRVSADPIHEADSCGDAALDSGIDPNPRALTQPQSRQDPQPDATSTDASSVGESAPETPSPQASSSDRPSRGEVSSDDVSDDGISSGGYLASMGKKPPPRSI